MEEKMYSVEEVADRLGLHVRTVRGYIRTGRLKAVRIGKQYRIAQADLQAFTGQDRPSAAPPVGVPAIEVSSIVQLDGVDRATADRLSTFVMAAVNTDRGGGQPLRLQVVHNEERSRMKIVILGGTAATAEVLHLLEAMLDDRDGLLAPEADGA